MGRALKLAPSEVHSFLARLRQKPGMTERKAKNELFGKWVADPSFTTIVAEERTFSEERNEEQRKAKWYMRFQLERDFPAWYVELTVNKAKANPAKLMQN